MRSFLTSGAGHRTPASGQLAASAGRCRAIGTDYALPGLVPVDLAPLRTPLTAAEVDRFRWLQNCFHNLIRFLNLAGHHRRSPSATSRSVCLLTASFPRLTHGLRSHPQQACSPARRGSGRYDAESQLARGAGRFHHPFVHFGAPPQQLVDGFEHAPRSTLLLHASRCGASSADLFA